MDYYPGKYLSRRLKNGAVIRSCPALHVVGADFGEMEYHAVTRKRAVIGDGSAIHLLRQLGVWESQAHLLCHAEERSDEASGEGLFPTTPDSSLRSE
jgi:hypothetical protein